jgi:transposase
VRHTRVSAKGMGLAGAVVERVELEGETNTLVVSVRVVWQDRDRCGICQRRAPGFDPGRGRRRWRALDLGTTVTELEADSPRVRCPEHGVVVTWVPWARHGSRFTRAFDEQAAAIPRRSWLETVMARRGEHLSPASRQSARRLIGQLGAPRTEVQKAQRKALMGITLRHSGQTLVVGSAPRWVRATSAS